MDEQAQSRLEQGVTNQEQELGAREPNDEE